MGYIKEKRMVKQVTRFSILKSIEKEKQFADLIVGIVNKYNTPDAVAKSLGMEITEKELQILRTAAKNGYPLSFSELQ